MRNTTMYNSCFIINLKKLGLFFLLIGSTFQYGDIIVSRYFIPMVSTILCWFIFFISLKKYNKFDLNLFFLHILFCIFFLILSIFGNAPPEETLFDFVKVPLAFSTSFLAYYFIVKNDTKSIYKILTLMLYSAALFLTLELKGRISMFDGNIDTALSNFYLLKIISPFMVDSNAVGLYALFYFTISLYLNGLNGFLYKKQNTALNFIFLFFIIASLSRAAIATALIILLINRWNTIPKIIKFLLIPIVVVSIIIGLYLAIGLITKDGSGLTKLNVLKNIADIAPGLDIKGFVFGYGINEGNYIYSYQDGAYSHLLLPMVLGQFGIIGMIFYVLFFVIGFYITNRYIFLFLIAMFVVGLSYLHPFLETIFLVNGILLGIFYKFKRCNRKFIPHLQQI